MRTDCAGEAGCDPVCESYGMFDHTIPWMGMKWCECPRCANKRQFGCGTCAGTGKRLVVRKRRRARFEVAPRCAMPGFFSLEVAWGIREGSDRTISLDYAVISPMMIRNTSTGESIHIKQGNSKIATLRPGRLVGLSYTGRFWRIALPPRSRRSRATVIRKCP